MRLGELQPCNYDEERTLEPHTSPSEPIGSVVSLYAGAGGLDLGFHRAGFNPVWANDINSAAVETYNKLLPGHVGISGPIEDQDLPASGCADLVIGGPPCQGFSVAGKMDPADPRSRHVMTFLNVVETIRPRAFVMENVKALAINRRWQSVLAALVERSGELGYKTHIRVLKASDFGVPQARERMFLLGMPMNTELELHPTTSASPPPVRSALDDLPAWGEPGNDSMCLAKVTPAKKPVLRRSPFAGMLFNGQGRPLDLDRPAPTLPASMGGNRTPIIDQKQLKEGGRSWVEKYHAHLWDGGEPSDEIPKFLRRLTVEEAAALQSFPAGMHWAGPQSAQFRQIGNAVPPGLAYHVAMAVRKALDLS